jgi:hypothetical protein
MVDSILSFTNLYFKKREKFLFEILFKLDEYYSYHLKYRIKFKINDVIIL